MRNTRFLITAILLPFLSSAQAESSSAPRYEHLIDVDYSFFSTRTKLQWGVDPFLKEPGFVKVPQVEEKFELMGILYNEEKPIAIINGLKVGVGDPIGERKVEEIGENFVILKKKESEIEITLPPIRDLASEEDEEEDSK